MKAAGAVGSLLSLWLASGCGYHLVHAAHEPLGPFAVVGGPAHTPDAALMAAAEEGARAELARAGELGSRGAPGEIEIELLRVEETSEGVALAAPDLPAARGVRITATGRARLRRAGGDTARDTGDVRASEIAARAGSTGSGLVVRDEAGRAAARRLGEILVRQLLGYAEPGEP